MLEYSDAFLRLNREALKRLEEIMSPAGFAVACQITLPDEDESEIDERRQG